MKSSQRIIARIRGECGVELPADVELRRTHAGRWQRSAGAWSWFLWSREWPHLRVGGYYPVTVLLKAAKLRAYVEYNGATTVEGVRDDVVSDA